MALTTIHSYRRKLIEVDLPLAVINQEATREHSNTTRHPASLHKWWARRPLTACRAIIFASLVDDPSSCPDEFPTPELQQAERERLHEIISRLARWENTYDETVLADARLEIARSIARSTGDPPPESSQVVKFLQEKAQPIYDPFRSGHDNQGGD